jgi:L-aminopeptidase/D-esterase-like protein
MLGMATASLGSGFRVGHWTNHDAQTGCTVVLPPRGNVTSCDIRGSSPGSRELVSLDPRRRLTEVHGVVLTGGSAYGLASADGVMRWLAERGIGYETPVAIVPIVPTAVVFDLGTGRGDVRPGADEGAAACDAAAEEFDTGRMGAGTGSTVGKWAGPEHSSPGGLGAARVDEAGHVVRALAVVNAVGDVIGDDGRMIAGTTLENPTFAMRALPPEEPPANTVLTVVTVEGALEKRDVQWLAARASDGVTVSVRPAHTRYDGDVSFAIAAPPRGDTTADLDILGPLVTRAVATAVRAAV